jgi:ubiquitin-like protein Pup
MSNEEVAAAQNVETNPSDEDISDVLDEIDGVLESNAEEFVRNYVQKGGQ